MTTKDYTIFRNIAGNRKIIPAHIEKLAAAIERKNLLKYFPILCNEKMEVIDGQHHLMAAAKLGYEVTYEVVPGLTLDDVMSINTSSKSWSISDFIDTYIQLGKKDYEVLKNFMNQYHCSASIAARLLGSATGGNTQTLGEQIREGTFRAYRLVFANRIAAHLIELKPYTDINVFADRDLINALIALDGNSDFDFERLVAKLRLSGQKIEARATSKYYLLEIEELYNYNAKKSKVELYASSQVQS